MRARVRKVMLRCVNVGTVKLLEVIAHFVCGALSLMSINNFFSNEIREFSFFLFSPPSALDIDVKTLARNKIQKGNKIVTWKRKKKKAAANKRGRGKKKQQQQPILETRHRGKKV